MIAKSTAAERLQREDEENAVVIAVVAALATSDIPAVPANPRSFWGDPAHRLGISRPGAHSWWVAGQAR